MEPTFDKGFKIRCNKNEIGLVVSVVSVMKNDYFNVWLFVITTYDCGFVFL